MDRLSTLGFIFSLGSAIVAWSCKKQSTVTLSNIKAEYKGATIATYEPIWLRRMLQDLWVEAPTPILIYCDNIISMLLAMHPMFHDCMKHKEVHYHFARETGPEW